MKDIDRADRLIKKQILSLNRHLPRSRKSLSELLKEDKPHVTGNDGTRHRFKWNELERLAKLIPEDDHPRLKLPIYIEIGSDKSGARISGRLECEIVNRILGSTSSENEIFIYRPDIKILRMELPTTTQYIFLVR
ncbi:MAG: DUF61 family protein [Methanobacteriaceae archaeon]|nr:DUF61 family protein [Methanobacteriaceae archaeon]